jgi:rRNA-processing protein FCF1
MTNQEIEDKYRANLTMSHAAALRGIFNAGFFCALEEVEENDTAMLASSDPSLEEDHDDVPVPVMSVP